jgi:hypothetical protein
MRCRPLLSTSVLAVMLAMRLVVWLAFIVFGFRSASVDDDGYIVPHLSPESEPSVI